MSFVCVVLQPSKCKGRDLQALSDEGWALDYDILYGVKRNCFVMIGCQRYQQNRTPILQILSIRPGRDLLNLVVLSSSAPLPINRVEAFLQHYRVQYNSPVMYPNQHVSIFLTDATTAQNMMQNVQNTYWDNVFLSCIDSADLKTMSRPALNSAIYEYAFQVEGIISSLSAVADTFNAFCQKVVVYESDVFYDLPSNTIMISSTLPPVSNPVGYVMSGQGYNLKVTSFTLVCNTPSIVQAPIVQAPIVQAPIVQAPIVQAPIVQAPIVPQYNPYQQYQIQSTGYAAPIQAPNAQIYDQHVHLYSNPNTNHQSGQSRPVTPPSILAPSQKSESQSPLHKEEAIPTSYYSVENIPIDSLEEIHEQLKSALGKGHNFPIYLDIALNRIILETIEAGKAVLDEFVKAQNSVSLSIFLVKCPSPKKGTYILPFYKQPLTIDKESISQEIGGLLDATNIVFDDTTYLCQFSSTFEKMPQDFISTNNHKKLRAYPTYPIRLLLSCRGNQSVFLEDIKKSMHPKECTIIPLFGNVHAAYFQSTQDAKEFRDRSNRLQESNTLFTIHAGCNIALVDLQDQQVEAETLVVGMKEWGISQPVINIDTRNSCAVAILPECAFFLTDRKIISVRLQDKIFKEFHVIKSIPLKLLVSNYDLKYWNQPLQLEKDLKKHSKFKAEKWSLHQEKCAFIIKCESKILHSSIVDKECISIFESEVIVERYCGEINLLAYDMAWFQSIFQKSFLDIYQPRRNLNRVWNSSECKRYLKSWQQLHKDHSNPTERAAQMSVYLSALLDSIGTSIRKHTIALGLITHPIKLHFEEVVVETSKLVTITPKENDKLVVVVKVAYALQEYSNMARASLKPVLVQMNQTDKFESQMRSGKPGHDSDIAICTSFCTLIAANPSRKMSLHDTETVENQPSIKYHPKTSVFRHSMDEGFQYLDPVETCDILCIYYQPPRHLGTRDHDPFLLRELHAQFCYAFFHAASIGHESLVICMDSHQIRSSTSDLCEVIRDALMLVGMSFKRIVIALHPSSNATIGKENLLDVCKAKLPENMPLLIKEEVILSTEVCQLGINCTDRTPTHSQRKLHPFKCTLSEKCPHLKSSIHNQIWDHTQRCPQWSFCVQHQDADHCLYNQHPPKCQQWNDCKIETEHHNENYLHPPPCKYGLECHFDKAESHWKTFRHLKTKCTDGVFCPKYNDPEHYARFEHPFAPICTKSPALCRDNSENHLKSFSHVCPWGRYCQDIKDAQHVKRFVHVVRPECGDIRSCDSVLIDSHCALYSHRGMMDIRKRCMDGILCPKRSELNHLQEYHHTNETHPYCVSKMLNDGIDFADNQKWIDACMGPHKKPVSQEIVAWFSGLKPVHRCSAQIFESIVSHGMLMSLESMGELSDPEYVAKETMNSPVVSNILKDAHMRHPAVQSNMVAILEDFILQSILQHTPNIDAGQLKYYTNKAKTSKGRLKDHGFTDEQFTMIAETVRLAAESCQKLKEKPTGIGFGVDVPMGTVRHVFSVLGPHLGGYYGAISIVLKQEILYHPDTNFTCCAATSFNSKRATENRPWIQLADKPAREVFDRFKLHATTPGWDKSIAEQLVASLVHLGPCTTVAELITNWEKVDSHYVIECHLPSFIPIAYIHKIIMPKNIYAKISQDTKDKLGKAFSNFEERVLRLTDIDQVDEKKIENATFEVARRSYKYFKSKIQMTGLYFSIDSNSITLIPNHLTEENKYLSFRANGRSFLIYFTEKKDALEDPGKSVTIYVNTETEHRGVYMFDGIVQDGLARISAGTNHKACAHFNSNLDPADFISYEICVEKSKIKMYHTGHQFYTNRSRIEYTVKASSTLRCVHFLAERNTVQLVDVRIHSSATETPRVEIPKIGMDATVAACQNPHALGDTVPLADGSDDLQRGQDQAGRGWFLGRAVNGAVNAVNAVTGLLGFRNQKDNGDGRAVKSGAGPSNSSGGSAAAPANAQQRRTSKSPSKSPQNPSPNSTISSSPTNSPRGFGSNVCKNGLKCTKFHEPDHRSQFTHNLKPPCKHGSQCHNGYKEHDPHTAESSHPCRFGVGCRNFIANDDDHNASYYHIPIPRCQSGRACTQLHDASHRQQFSHTGMPDILIPCRHGQRCRDLSNPDHVRVYSHG
eukprot:TRINITY_DN5703_c0_g1_i1.p1 TRINITY_DN5703_c0_g1~~TRINITY_DN5703_c0_g1_i1.p1  ORF type:complete len:2124 (-),score=354.70 TRINITY_DN5703_c0_g1_i1:254-6625(-)